MKKLFTILLVAMMLLSCACAAPAATPTPAAPAPAAAEPAAEPAAAPAAETTSASAPEYTIKIGHSDTTTNLIHVSLENFAAYVAEKSNGRVKVDIYATEQLGSNSEMAEMVQMGTLDAMMMPQGQEANYAPKINALGLPFLFSSYPQVYAVLDSDVGAGLVDEDLAKNNMVQLAYWENGLRQVTNSVRAIEKPEDLKGLKIRTPEDAITLAIFNALGASPSPLAFSELYLALQQGTFDGQENPVSNIYANNFQDVQKYISITNHKYESKNMIFAKNVWDSYPADVQTLLLEGAKLYGKEHREAIASSADQMLSELETAGMQVSRPDTSLFQAATASVYDDFYAKNDWAKDTVKAMQDIIASVG